ncbi:hypothetical protein TBS_16560 [Thermobispora bispora]
MRPAKGSDVRGFAVILVLSHLDGLAANLALMAVPVLDELSNSTVADDALNGGDGYRSRSYPMCLRNRSNLRRLRNIVILEFDQAKPPNAITVFPNRRPVIFDSVEAVVAIAVARCVRRPVALALRPATDDPDR